MKDFKVQWANGKFPGWAKEKEAHGALKHSSAHLDLSPYTSASELQALGLERLKSALMALGLKCGGLV
jgi:splicing factor 3A subunit 3